MSPEPPTIETAPAGDARTFVIVADHRSFADMLALAAGAVPGLSCVGTASSTRAGLELVTRLRPDVVVMDIQMPGQDGLAATRHIRSAVPSTIVVVVTAHTSAEWVSKAAQAGASGFVAKNGSLSEMITVLSSARVGQLAVGPSVFAPRTDPEPDSEPRPDVPALSRRELDVLRLLARGVPARTVAPDLGITLNTCRGYIKSVRVKLDAANQVEAVLRARALGLLDPEPPPVSDRRDGRTP